MILLPTEPYHFRPRHRDELRAALRATTAAKQNRIHLVDGRWLFWYGPRMAEALLGLMKLLHGIAATPPRPDNAVRHDFLPLWSTTPARPHRPHRHRHRRRAKHPRVKHPRPNPHGRAP